MMPPSPTIFTCVRAFLWGPRRCRSESGSALVLVLLITALLATSVVSFLATARIEQLAARNFTLQNNAAGLAGLATQQAMAKIQQGFTVSGNATTVITTQPGAIRQFQFSGGNCTLAAEKELFSGTGNATTVGTANLNNLQNPGNSTSSATSAQWTITGNIGEAINVPLEVVRGVDGNPVGRIAYYVDDEGTKLNANIATGNRTSLNAVLRPLDIGALSTNASSSLSGIINITSNNTGSIVNWNYFFRPEQVAGAVSGISGDDVSFISTAASSAISTADITHLLTPWGTQRLYINELPITSAGVNRTFTSFSGISSNGAVTDDLANGRALNNIFGGNFSTKYTALGVKQIAANMLQMRDPNTFSINASGNYSGALLGADNLDANGIPREYLGYAPYPVISEIGFSCAFVYERNVSSNATLNKINYTPHVNLITQPTIEIYNPYPYPFVFNSGYPRLIVEFSGFSVDLNFTYNGNTTTTTITHQITSNSTITPLPANAYPFLDVRWMNPQVDDEDKMFYYDALSEFLPVNSQGKPYIPAQTKIQTHFYSYYGGNDYGMRAMIRRVTASNTITPPSNVDYPAVLHSLSNMTIGVKSVRLLANSNNGAADIQAGQKSTIRDWVSGNETGWIKADINLNGSMPFTCNNTNSRVIANQNAYVPKSSSLPTSVPTSSASRISFLNRYPADALTTGNTTNWYNPNPGAPTWSTNSSTKFGNQGNATETNPNNSNSLPSSLSAQTIPSDPSWNNSLANAVYANDAEPNDMREPFLGIGIYTSPADLGFVPTNNRWRRLRMQMRPASEGSLIPDWAMLDVISFGNSTNANLPYNRFQPVNINGRFRLPGNATVAPRTIGIKALAKVLEMSSNGTIQDPLNLASSSPMNAAKFRGNTANATTIANAIGNMTWSANSTWGNSTSNSINFRRNALNFPVNQYILPSEIMEIAGVADAVLQTDYNNSNSHFKRNEGRASALIPAVTTRSSFFTIYAYAQAGQLRDKNQPESASNPFVFDSEALTKTLVEVEIETPATATAPTFYKVKKLYSQPISSGM
jgi:hypothetical protein